MDSCPHTGLPVLVGSVTLSCFYWLRVSRSNLVRSRVSSLPFVTSLPAPDNWVLGFTSIRWMSLLLLATSESKLHVQLSLKEIVGGGRGDTQVCGIWFLQISSQLLSRYNKLGVYRTGWLRLVLFDRTSILFVEQAENWPGAPYLGALSTFACKMQDVFWSDQALLGLDDSYAWDSRLWRIPSVCPCLNFVLPVSILNLWWSVFWPHIQFDKCTWRNRPE